MYREKMAILLSTIIYPFTSYDAFKNNPMKSLAKETSCKDYKNNYENSVKQNLYRYLLRKYTINNLDYVDMIFEKYYGHASIENKECGDIYLNIIGSFSNSFICHRNGKIALKYWETEEDEKFIGPYKGINKIALWNTLNRLMCTDIIVIFYLVNNGFDDTKYLSGYYSSIMLEDLQLEKILSKGVAETHIHKGAAINFSISWIHLMNLSSSKSKEYNYKNLVNPLYQYEDIGYQVNMIAILRVVLVYYLSNHRNNDFYSVVHKLLKEKKNKIYEFILNIIEAVEAGSNKVKGINELYEFKNIWEDLKFKFNLDMSNENEDYVVQLLGNGGTNTSGENIYIFEALKYMRKNEDDQLFKKLFFQYINIKNEVFQGKVQEDSIKGLRNFQPNYNRSTFFEGYSAKEYWLLLMRTQLQNKHLRKLEFRFAFDTSKRSLVKVVKNFLKAYQELLRDYNDSDFPPQIALVFHMIKMVDDEWYEKCWQNTFNLQDSEDIAKELFYNENQLYYLNQIKVFKELRSQVKGLDDFLIGIDAASIEYNTEPWVFAPVYNEARGRQDESVAYDMDKPIKTLGFTFHVGEDFRHILTGLRHVDEVIEHFSYHSGDRIGHGIVLGLDVPYWCQNNQVVMLPRGEYLDNLLWLWGLKKDNVGLEGLDISYLEQQIMKLAEEVYLNVDGISIYILWKVYQEKFKVFKPNERFKYIYASHCKSDKTEENINDNSVFCRYLPDKYLMFGQRWSYETLLYVQHCRCYCQKLLEPIQVEIDNTSINLYKALQSIVLGKVNSKGIVIESNPTSNLVLGEMKDLFNHYIFNLNDLDMQNKDKRTIFSINSDDPSVFNTNVSNEFSYIYYALQKQGYSREEILIWIDKIRGYGVESSFISDKEHNTKALSDKITHILRELEY